MGAAKFLAGLARRVAPSRIDVIVNTADDDEFYGLHVSPDLDTVTYTLAGVNNRVTGWGLANDSFVALRALERFWGRAWFKLGDRDFATHIYRTQRLREGAPLSQVAAEIARAFRVQARIMPMTDDQVRTFVRLRGVGPVPFQEYLVRRQSRGKVEEIELRGVDTARALPAAVDALVQARAIIVAPSNPLVSIGPILALREIAATLEARRQAVAAISPLVGGRPVKGPADKMMRGLGLKVSASSVARLYQGRVGLFVVDSQDRAELGAIERLGMRAIATDTIMKSPERAARLADAVLRAMDA